LKYLKDKIYYMENILKKVWQIVGILAGGLIVILIVGGAISLIVDAL